MSFSLFILGLSSVFILGESLSRTLYPTITSYNTIGTTTLTRITSSNSSTDDGPLMRKMQIEAADSGADLQAAAQGVLIEQASSDAEDATDIAGNSFNLRLRCK
jgi:hypothetical protein